MCDPSSLGLGVTLSPRCGQGHIQMVTPKKPRSLLKPEGCTRRARLHLKVTPRTELRLRIRNILRSISFRSTRYDLSKLNTVHKSSPSPESKENNLKPPPASVIRNSLWLPFPSDHLVVCHCVPAEIEFQLQTRWPAPRQGSQFRQLPEIPTCFKLSSKWSFRAFLKHDTN